MAAKPEADVRFAAELRFFLTPSHRDGQVRVACDGVSSLGDQLHDVLDRFRPPLAPWTRCTMCNGQLAAVRKVDVEPLLPPGTRRTYQAFSRCAACGRVYWHGAHGRRLDDIVDSAIRTVAASRP